MGKRGPPKTPTKTLKDRGSWRGKKRDKTEPRTPAQKEPAVPAWMPPKAKTCWKWLTPRLFALGILDRIDDKLIEEYCVTYSRWRDAEFYVKKHGDIYWMIDAQGNEVPRIHPKARLAETLLGKLLSMQGKMGMSAADRAGIAKPAGPRSSTGKGDGAFGLSGSS